MLTEKERKIKLVQELRQLTGRGMMDCKKCLEESNWDINKAERLILLSKERFSLKDGAIWH